MNRIRLLPEQVANQIAAGEVVERPASVVKELVENALDARSQRVTVEIQAGGRSLIRVTDDGLGMGRDDALLSLERHATSKIQKAEDLYAIATMGFRGEALPSIASVSRFVLTTREREGGSAEGTQIVVNGGKIVEAKAAGSPPGTCVEVRQLFFNLPARRKFLRSEETEAAHIQHYLTLAALAYPEVAFTFSKDGRVIWQLPGVKAADATSALRERHRALYGAGQKMLAVEFSDFLPLPVDADDENEPAERPRLRLWGLTGAPGVSRATRDEQHLFVNRRPVENRGLNAALLEGYHNALMKGRYPVCCLFLEISPSLVDVNIHPAKREVKFHHERAVRGLVGQAIRSTLMKLNAPAGLPEEPVPPGERETPAEFARPIAPVAPPAPAVPEPSPVQGELAAADQPPLEVLAAPLFNRPTWTAPERKFPPPPAPQPATAISPSPIAETVPLLQVPLRLIGVIGKLYVVLESDRGLVLLDQHAAHERILYEQMLSRLEKEGNAPSQRLLLPETVELPPREASFLRGQLPALTRLGVGLSEFGERTFLLDALPPFVHVASPRDFVIRLVDELKAAGSEVNTLRLGEDMVAKTVCRHAVKAHDPLKGIELENLIRDLRQCQMPYTCPHGRPTLVEMNWRELEKKFGRVQ